MSYQIVTRDEWGARHGRGNPTAGAKTRAIAHHDGHDRSKPGMTFEQECDVMRLYEHYHVFGEGDRPGLTAENPRIGYSFAVFQSSRIFEGCGWGRIGAHTKNLNSSAYAWVFPINGAVTAPTPEAIAAFRWHLSEGVRLGHLAANHIVSGHQDHGKPTCPGELVYDLAVRGVAPVNEPPRLADVIMARPSLRLGKGGESASVAERAAVIYLQHRLIEKGFLQAKLADGRSAATGFFGTVTAFAVKQFQVANGLKPDSIVGMKTWEALTR